jgi:pyruvate/2-oxoglutarate dehydrogenase complex dihydrolipoamide acyltransferase (E2) component
MNSSSPRLRRGAVAVAGWLAAAFLATGVTLAAVTLIGSGIFGESTRTRSQAEVAQALASLDPTGASSTAPTSEPTSPPVTSQTPVRRVITSAGGTVLAECSGRDVTVISWTPAQGYRVDDVDLAAQRDVEVRFEGEDTEVRVKIRCTDGRPDAEIEEHD